MCTVWHNPVWSQEHKVCLLVFFLSERQQNIPCLYQRYFYPSLRLAGATVKVPSIKTTFVHTSTQRQFCLCERLVIDNKEHFSLKVWHAVPEYKAGTIIHFHVMKLSHHNNSFCNSHVKGQPPSHTYTHIDSSQAFGNEHDVNQVLEMKLPVKNEIHQDHHQNTNNVC